MKTFITLFGIMIFSISASAQDGQVYEYLTMVKLQNDIHVSIGSDGYEKFNIKSETEDKQFDLSAVNRQISAYESEGWEFVSADHTFIYSGSNVLTYHVVMRRPKE